MRRLVTSTLVGIAVVMAADSCDHVTDKDAADHLVEAMRRAVDVERETGRYPTSFEDLGMADLRSFTSTWLVPQGGGLCIELLIQEGGASHVVSDAPEDVQAGRCPE